MKKGHLHNIKTPGFKIPEDYLDTFEDRLFKKINTQDSLASISEPGYTVPDTYFDTFEARLEARLNNHQSPQVIKLRPWRKVALASSVAAAVLLLFTIIIRSQNELSINQIETASIEAYLKDQNLSSYDIASFLNEEDLIVDNFAPTTFTEDSLESYLLNHTSIEDLIIGK